MRFTFAAVSTLIAAASAAAVPRSDMGSWAVSVVKNSAANGYKSEDITAVYTNSELPEAITSTCSFKNLTPEGVFQESKVCDPESFDYTLSYEGTSWFVSLQQVVELNGEKVTVFGKSEGLTLDCNSATGRYCTAETTVPVTAATA
ncbi:hypothetical protein BS50DRAFT_625467 [Corynespora cassiicola Philippines]|uniref:AA1-like domain-containing protein n=1 Tax=Corynespora cassiicola Philippines TaxID=1448308 RepID=A0A2T2N706_CORCC|nr:hypothetical protein BS50DRAFT_625467 [Corynespora cassiicola Philippines]